MTSPADHWPAQQQPVARPMGTFGSVFWGVLLANLATLLVVLAAADAIGN